MDLWYHAVSAVRHAPSVCAVVSLQQKLLDEFLLNFINMYNGQIPPDLFGIRLIELFLAKIWPKN